MSSDIRFLRKFGSVKSYVKNIADKFAAYRSTQQQVDQEQYKTNYRTKRYRLLFLDLAAVANLGINKLDNRFTFEPDGQYTTMMFNFELSIRDQSGFGNHAFAQFKNNQPQFSWAGVPVGAGNEEPMPWAIPFYGAYDKLIIPFSDSNQLVFETTTGFSIFIRLRVDVSSLHGGVQRVIWSKMDDLDNAAMAWVRPINLGAAFPGDFVVFGFVVRKAAVQYQIRSVIGFPLNTWIDVWFIWNDATNTPLIYHNAMPANTIQGDSVPWPDDTSEFIIGNSGLGDRLGNFYGIIGQFFLYRNKVVTFQEVQNMWANGCTIANIIPDAFTGISIFGKSGFGTGTGTGPLGNDFKNADFVDADFVVDAAPIGDSFDDTSFDAISFG